MVKYCCHPNPRLSHQLQKIQFWRNRVTKTAHELISSHTGVRWTSKCSCHLPHIEKEKLEAESSRNTIHQDKAPIIPFKSINKTECIFFPGNRVYSTRVQHKNISQIMKTSLLKISTKIDPTGTRLSVPPKTRQKNPAYKTCQRWPVSIPLTAEAADCFIYWEKEVWHLYLKPQAPR